MIGYQHVTLNNGEPARMKYNINMQSIIYRN